MKRLMLILAGLVLLLVVADVALRICGCGGSAGREILGDGHPRLGWGFRPGRRVVPPGGPPFTINLQGLRGAAMPPLKESGEVRILVLGGAGALGVGVKDEETIAARLADRLARRGMEVKAAAAGGDRYALDQLLLLWKESLASLKPDLVVLALEQTDFDALLRSSRLGRPKPCFPREGNDRLALAATPPPATVPATAGGLWQILFGSTPGYNVAGGRVDLEYGVFILQEPGPVLDSWSRATQLLIRLDREIRRAGALTLVTMLPGRIQLEPDRFKDLLGRWGVESKAVFVDRPDYNLMRICKAKGIRFISCFDYLRKGALGGRTMVSRELGLPTPLGHDSVAAILEASLVDANWRRLNRPR